MMETPIEIEYKFPVENHDALRQKLADLGAVFCHSQQQTDEYLNDPLRDFSKIDVALRLRQTDDQTVLTFKGPNLDPAAKIRHEIETPLVNAEAADQIRQTFLGIGFCSVAKVTKHRTVFALEWESHAIEICLDSVEGVGDFVELEIVVQAADQQTPAKHTLESLAQKLNLSGSIRTSYLELLLQKPADRQ